MRSGWSGTPGKQVQEKINPIRQIKTAIPIGVCRLKTIERSATEEIIEGGHNTGGVAAISM